MRPRIRNLTFSLLIGFAIAAMNMPQAVAEQGVVNAALYRNLPEGFPISVDSYDDSDLSLGVLERVIAGLRQRGVLVMDDAPLKLMVDTTIQDGRLRVPGLDGTDTYTQREGINPRIQRQTQLSDERIGVPLSRQQIEGVGSLTVDAVLRDLETGEVIWKGDATAPMADVDPSRIGNGLVPGLVRSYGKTVRREIVEIE